VPKAVTDVALSVSETAALAERARTLCLAVAPDYCLCARRGDHVNARFSDVLTGGAMAVAGCAEQRKHDE
jgi:hypothetical protein